MNMTVIGSDGKTRCRWCVADPGLLAYHDQEWGFPVVDDLRLFEKLSLESFQSGLSWRTILSKRDNFRRAFHGFDFYRIARFTSGDIDRLLLDEGIVRHRGKIESVVNNAIRAVELVQKAGSLAIFVWGYEPDPAQCSSPQIDSVSSQAVALARNLKKQGWKFVGPTTVHAFMQAMGLINGHASDCVIRGGVECARNHFQRP